MANYYYSYYNKINHDVLITTNIRALSKASGVSYHTLRYWFRNGTEYKDTGEFTILKSELVKGKQRIVKQSGETDEWDKLLRQ